MIEVLQGVLGTIATLLAGAAAVGEIEPADGINLRLDVDNLFDETFYTNSFSDVWVEPGAPRRFRVSASYSF